MKKFKTLSMIAIISAGFANTANAQSMEYYLALIEQHTKTTMENLNNIPTYIQGFFAFAYDWTNPDDTKKTADLQAAFSTLTTAQLAQNNGLTEIQSAYLTDFFGKNFNPQDLPYANDLVYQSLLNQPYLNPDPRKKDGAQQPDLALNYTKMASAVSVKFPLPPIVGPGGQYSKNEYATVYNTVSSVQTYNAYLLSQLYIRNKNKSQISDQQKKLDELAGSSEWFSEIASEKIGVVLRQILMFNSQIYLTLNKINQNQQDLLTAIAMNNSLLVSLNRLNADMVYQKATGKVPE